MLKNFSKVRRVCLEIGPFSGVEIDALKFGFDVVMKDTLANEAMLDIEETRGMAWCMQCAETVEIKQRYEPCGHCGSYQLQISSGDEMRIKELEVD